MLAKQIMPPSPDIGICSLIKNTCGIISNDMGNIDSMFSEKVSYYKKVKYEHGSKREGIQQNVSSGHPGSQA